MLPSLCAALLSSHCPLTAPPSQCLISPAGCCVASRHTTLLLSSCSAALSSSYASWLLCCLLSRRPLVLSSCCPLVLLSSSTLNLSSLGFLDPFDTTFVVPWERSSRTSPVWPLAHARWSRCLDLRSQTAAPTRQQGVPHSPMRSTQGGSWGIRTGAAWGQGGRIVVR